MPGDVVCFAILGKSAKVLDFVVVALFSFRLFLQRKNFHH